MEGQNPKPEKEEKGVARDADGVGESDESKMVDKDSSNAIGNIKEPIEDKQDHDNKNTDGFEKLDGDDKVKDITESTAERTTEDSKKSLPDNDKKEVEVDINKDYINTTEENDFKDACVEKVTIQVSKTETADGMNTEVTASYKKAAAHHDNDDHDIIEVLEDSDEEELLGACGGIGRSAATRRISVKKYADGTAPAHYERVEPDPEDGDRFMEEPSRIHPDGYASRTVPAEGSSLRGAGQVAVISKEAFEQQTEEQVRRRRQRNEANAIPYVRRSSFRVFFYNWDHLQVHIGICILIFIAAVFFVIMGCYLIKLLVDWMTGSGDVFPNSTILPDSFEILPTEVISQLLTSYISPSVSQPYEFQTSDES